jgi:hypothetical protein
MSYSGIITINFIIIKKGGRVVTAGFIYHYEHSYKVMIIPLKALFLYHLFCCTTPHFTHFWLQTILNGNEGIAPVVVKTSTKCFATENI